MRKYFILSLTTLVVFFGVTAFQSKADAVTGADWQAGRIIDDSIFQDSSSMSASQIQQFLNSKVPTCDTMGTQLTSTINPATGHYYTRAQLALSKGQQGPPYTCLKDFYEVPKTTPGPGDPVNNYGGKPIPPGAISAAQIIYNAGQAYGISPKVLLVTIQKESVGPLIVDDWPYYVLQYKYALGAHCPDTSACDSNYSGFSMQVYESARLFRYYLDNMSQPWWPYKKIGYNSIYFNPNLACGATTINITTSSTAALYTYTPYQPNQAALSNLYGTGDVCSAYGNRNFWRIFNDWFGETTRTLVISNGGTYKIENGLKRPFPSEIVFLSNGYKWSEVKAISSSELNLISPGAPMTYNVHYRDSRTVYSQSGVYLVQNGIKQAFPDVGTFLGSGFSWSNLIQVSQSELDLIPTGAPLQYDVHARDGALVKSSASGGLSLIENGTQRAFPTAVSFLSNGFKWSNVITISPDELSLIPVGTPVPYSPQYRDGNVVKSPSSGGIYLVENGMKRAFPSATIFLSNGFKWSDVITISPDELGLIPDGAAMASGT